MWPNILKTQFYNEEFLWCNQHIQPKKKSKEKKNHFVIYGAPGHTNRKHKRGSGSSVKMFVSKKDHYSTKVFKGFYGGVTHCQYNISYCTFGSINHTAPFYCILPSFFKVSWTVLLIKSRRISIYVYSLVQRIS